MNLVLKSKIKPYAPLIVAAQIQPLLKVTDHFAQFNYIESNNEERIMRIAERDNLSIDFARRKTKFAENHIDFEKFKDPQKYKNLRIWHNDYKSLPEGFEEYAKSLKDLTR
jgi:uncharacterized membrane protein